MELTPNYEEPLFDELTHEVLATPHELAELSVTVIELLKDAPYEYARSLIYSACADGSYIVLQEGEKFDGQEVGTFAKIAFMNDDDEEMWVFKYDGFDSALTTRERADSTELELGATAQHMITEARNAFKLSDTELAVLESIEDLALIKQKRYENSEKREPFNMYEKIKEILGQYDKFKVRVNTLSALKTADGKIISLEESQYDGDDEHFDKDQYTKVEVTIKHPNGVRAHYKHYHDNSATFVESRLNSDGSKQFSNYVEDEAEVILREAGRLRPTQRVVTYLQATLNELATAEYRVNKEQ